MTFPRYSYRRGRREGRRYLRSPFRPSPYAQALFRRQRRQSRYGPSRRLQSYHLRQRRGALRRHTLVSHSGAMRRSRRIRDALAQHPYVHHYDA